MTSRHVVAAVIVMLGASAGPIDAQDRSFGLKSRPAGGPSFQVEEAISLVEERFASALAARDRKALDNLLATPFTWVHSSDGRVDTREVFLESAARGMALSGQRSARSEHGTSLTFHPSDSRSPQSAIRVSRIRLLDPSGAREIWMRQTHVLVRDSDGSWRLAFGQGTVMYEGPLLDSALHARYAGTYVISPERTLKLSWEDNALLAQFPNGSKTQIFLASPTEEASRTTGGARLRFTLGPDGTPVVASLVRDDREVWRAERKTK